MPRVGERRVLVVALHPHVELPLLVVRLRLGSLQDPRVEQRVLPEDALVREPVLTR